MSSPTANVLPLRRPGQPLTTDAPEHHAKPERERWAFIPRSLDDYGLTTAEFRVYCRVARRAGVTNNKRNGVCNEKLSNLARACHVTPLTVRHALRFLTKCGLLAKEKRKRRTDCYRPTPEACWMDKAHLKATRIAVRSELAPKKKQEPKDRPKPLRSGVLEKSSNNTPEYQSETRSHYQFAVAEGTPSFDGNPLEGVCVPEIPETQHAQSQTTTHAQDSDSSKKEQPKPSPPLSLYREICGATLNKTQRALITENITDATIWKAVLTQFMTEGQSVRRVDWLIERYHKRALIEEIKADEDSLQDIAATCGRVSAASAPVEPPFTSAEFSAAWLEFERARKEVGNPVSLENRPRVYQSMLGMSEQEAVSALRHLLQDGWTSKIECGDRTPRQCVGCDQEIGEGQRYARRNKTTITDEGRSCEITEQHAHLLCLDRAAEGGR